MRRPAAYGLLIKHLAATALASWLRHCPPLRHCERHTRHCERSEANHSADFLPEAPLGSPRRYAPRDDGRMWFLAMTVVLVIASAAIHLPMSGQ